MSFRVQLTSIALVVLSIFDLVAQNLSLYEQISGKKVLLSPKVDQIRGKVTIFQGEVRPTREVRTMEVIN